MTSFYLELIEKAIIEAAEQSEYSQYDRLNDQCQILTCEIDDLRRALTDITRCLDEPDNNASQVEILEAI